MKYFHGNAQVVKKLHIIMELYFQGETFQIRHQNYSSTNQRNFFQPSCFGIEIKVLLILNLEIYPTNC